MRPSLFLYGAPGAGKSFLGALLRDEYGYDFAEGDEWLTDDMVASLARGESFTAAQRDAFADVVVDAIRRSPKRPLVVAQAMFKRSHRARIAAAHPDLRMVRVACDDAVRYERLAARSGGVEAGLGARMVRDLEADEGDFAIDAGAPLEPQLEALLPGARGVS